MFFIRTASLSGARFAVRLTAAGALLFGAVFIAGAGPVAAQDAAALKPVPLAGEICCTPAILSSGRPVPGGWRSSEVLTPVRV